VEKTTERDVTMKVSDMKSDTARVVLGLVERYSSTVV
jgi:hypothetical protein